MPSNLSQDPTSRTPTSSVESDAACDATQGSAECCSTAGHGHAAHGHSHAHSEGSAEHCGECIQSCDDCHNACLKTINECLRLGGEHVEARHIGLLQDCAQMCHTAHDFLLRQSPLHKLTCHACAEISEACAEQCELTGHAACAAACRACCESCRSMSATAV